MIATPLRFRGGWRAPGARGYAERRASRQRCPARSCGIGREAKRTAAGPGEGPVPLLPRLDLARDPVEPEAGPAVPAPMPADALAVETGRRIGPVLTRSQHTTLAAVRVLDPHGVVVAS